MLLTQKPYIYYSGENMSLCVMKPVQTPVGWTEKHVGQYELISICFRDEKIFTSRLDRRVAGLQ